MPGNPFGKVRLLPNVVTCSNLSRKKLTLKHAELNIFFFVDAPVSLEWCFGSSAGRTHHRHEAFRACVGRSIMRQIRIVYMQNDPLAAGGGSAWGGAANAAPGGFGSAGADDYDVVEIVDEQPAAAAPSGPGLKGVCSYLQWSVDTCSCSAFSTLRLGGMATVSCASS